MVLNGIRLIFRRFNRWISNGMAAAASAYKIRGFKKLRRYSFAVVCFRRKIYENRTGFASFFQRNNLLFCYPLRSSPNGSSRIIANWFFFVNLTDFLVIIIFEQWQKTGEVL